MQNVIREPEQSDFDHIVFSDMKLRKVFKVAQRHALKSEWEKALPGLVQVWKKYPDNKNLLLILSYGLSTLGARKEAMGILKQYLLSNPPTPAICEIIINLARSMKIYDVAEKLVQILIGMEPSVGEHYSNYVLILFDQEKYDEAIELCQQMVPIFPKEASLWNALAICVQYRDGFEDAIVFYEQALELKPEDARVLYNLSLAKEFVGGYNSSLPYLEKAYEMIPDNTEVNMGLAFAKFWKGDLIGAWEHYSIRLNSTRNREQHIIYTHKLPEWNGSSLKGKTLFATCEQGIGDEVMFASILPKVYEEAKQLIIGVDRRLVSIFERSFPNAIVCEYVDKISHGYRYRIFPRVQKQLESGELKVDFACPFATIASFYWKKPEDIKPNKKNLFVSDPEKLRDFEARLANISSKPRVGLAWTTGNKSKTRAHLYPAIEDMKAIMALKRHVTFVNLQYGDVADSLKEFKDQYDVDVINFDDVNLKDDIEANIALIQCCDLVVSVTSAPVQFTLATGTPIIILSLKSSIWWGFGLKTKVPFVEEDKNWIIHGDDVDGWEEIIPKAVTQAREILNIN